MAISDWYSVEELLARRKQERFRPHARQLTQDELDRHKAEFFERGGTIQVIPRGVSGDQIESKRMRPLCAGKEPFGRREA